MQVEPDLFQNYLLIPCVVISETYFKMHLINFKDLRRTSFLRRKPVLTIQNLSKTYANGIQALKNVSLEIPRGMFGLVGPNGAGKSTLMRTIATLQEPDTGTITLDGLDALKEKEKSGRSWVTCRRNSVCTRRSRLTKC